MKLKIIGDRDVDKLLNWCKKHEHLLGADPYKSSINRKTCEYGIDRDSQLIKVLHDILPPGLLFYPTRTLFLKYGPNGGIKQHRDQGKGAVVSTIATEDYVLTYDGGKYPIAKGQVTQFASKLLHSVDLVKKERYVIAWWYDIAKI